VFSVRPAKVFAHAKRDPVGATTHRFFATKPGLARIMVGRAIDAGLFGWVAADEEYGQHTPRREEVQCWTHGSVNGSR
jgi:SRSO17 transposase